MSNFRGSMAGDLLASGVKLNDDVACSLALLAAGWRARHVGEWLHDAMALARAMSAACDRVTILRDMAHPGDAPPDVSGIQGRPVTGLLSSPLDLPGASASGLFEAAQ